MLIAIKDKQEKQFLFRHSRICFELLDTDNSKSISPREFETFGFLFNFGTYSIRQIFKEFDVSGDKELDYNEFRMFTFACIDRQRQIDAEKEKKRRKKNKQTIDETLQNELLQEIEKLEKHDEEQEHKPKPPESDEEVEGAEAAEGGEREEGEPNEISEDNVPPAPPELEPVAPTIPESQQESRCLIS